LYEYLRYEGTGKGGCRNKRFVGRAPDGNGGWKYNLAGIRRVPYRLPELTAARKADVKQSVIVVEGEKHADALAKLKFIATTNAGGTSYDWPLSWAKQFDGALRIFLIADADAPGRKAMKQRETLLKNSGHTVFTVDLYPDRNDGSDILDWMREAGFAKLSPLERRKKIIEKLSGYCLAQGAKHA
jgi:putative DNA primase/helicase